MNIVWTFKAEYQLDRIVEYIALDSPYYAYKTADAIIEQTEQIVDHPRKGRMVPEYREEDIREVFYHPYRIIYQLSGSQIIILSVIHEARQLGEGG